MAQSSDPFKYPKIVPNYLSNKEDVRVIVEGMRQARKIFSQSAIHSFSAGEISPGISAQSDSELEDFARKRGGIIYHPVSTCRMGEDPMSVVDSQLKVHGIFGLRVVDASIMPTVTTGNTNAPTIMIAEKASSMIIQDARENA